jgi:hypothetical protein
MKVTDLKADQKILDWDFLENNEGIYTCVSEARPELVFISLTGIGGSENKVFVFHTMNKNIKEVSGWRNEKFSKMNGTLTLEFTNS